MPEPQFSLPDGWVRVRFRLAGGPVHSLGMSAEQIAPDRIRLHRAPWSPLGAAKDDEFRVRPAEGRLWVEEKLVASGYCAVRLWAPHDFPPDRFRDAVLGQFRPLGVDGTGMFGLVVLDVRRTPISPPSSGCSATGTGRTTSWS